MGLFCIISISLLFKNGVEFLRIAKKDDKLKQLPVVILTTSHEEMDRIDTFSLGIAGYMVKPVDYKQFVEVVKAIKMYWSLSELP